MPSRILVVDDDARVATTLVDVLAHHGHDARARGVGRGGAARRWPPAPSTSCSSTSACPG